MKKILIVILLVIALFLPTAIKAEAHESNLFASILGLGIGIWGFTRNTTYGYITGSIFLVSGMANLNLLTVRF